MRVSRKLHPPFVHLKEFCAFKSRTGVPESLGSEGLAVSVIESYKLGFRHICIVDLLPDYAKGYGQIHNHSQSRGSAAMSCGHI